MCYSIDKDAHFFVGNWSLCMREREQIACRQQMWSDHKESCRLYYSKGEGLFFISSLKTHVGWRSRGLLPDYLCSWGFSKFRNMQTNWAFPFLRLLPRTLQTSSKPSWPWLQRSRTGSVPQHPLGQQVKSRSTRLLFKQGATRLVAKNIN